MGASLKLGTPKLCLHLFSLILSWKLNWFCFEDFEFWRTLPLWYLQILSYCIFPLYLSILQISSVSLEWLNILNFGGPLYCDIPKFCRIVSFFFIYLFSLWLINITWNYLGVIIILPCGNVFTWKFHLSSLWLKILDFVGPDWGGSHIVTLPNFVILHVFLYLSWKFHLSCLSGKTFWIFENPFEENSRLWCP